LDIRPLRILWVKADKLLPVHNGGNIRSYHIARRLASQHELTFLSYYGGAPDLEYESELGRLFPGAVCIRTGKGSQTDLSRGLDYLVRLPLAAPYAVSRFSSAPVRQALRQGFDGGRFDVAVCDFLDAAVNFPTDVAIPTALFQHNVETEIWRRHVLTEPSQLKKLVYGIEFLKMLRYERTRVQKFQHVIAVSDHDKRLMAAWVDASRITVVPTGVDLQQYKPEPSSQPTEPLVMFVGAMDWEPNVDAVEYFCGEVWPLVLADVPDARFRIVGRNPRRQVLQLASDAIEVTGSVPSVADHLRQAAVVVVPLRIGGGTRLKIYEAMAAGKAVVSTSVGAEGLDVHPGHDILFADDAQALAQGVVTLLRDRELRARYEQAAAQLAAQYAWPAIGDNFMGVLERLAERADTGRQRPLSAKPRQREPEGVVYLMYHELERPGHALCQNEPGYLRYVLRKGEFQIQLALLSEHGFRGLNVSQDRGGSHADQAVVVTFDDGCETDLTVAAPLLLSRGFNATFYLVTGFIGRQGYLSAIQARELAEMGFEIGCHSRTHAYLAGLSEKELEIEVVEAKDRLEQLVGRRVYHLSCPGGRWSSKVARVALQAGYRTVATSRIGTNSAHSNPFCLSRVAVLRGLPSADFLRLSRGRGLALQRFAQSVRLTAQRVLGDSRYDWLRGAWLGRS
jgi:polysaccharide biosynthesis protein PslH